MYIVQVHIQVKPGCIDSFIAVSKENALASLQEPGVVRFDIYQQEEDPTLFEFLETYLAPEDALRHRETPHFNRWRQVAEPMLVKPRTRTVYRQIIPSEKIT